MRLRLDMKSTGLVFPSWVPETAIRYLLHTEMGYSIRDLARSAGCHASTVLRQIRKMETRRDDPHVDALLSALSDQYCARPTGFSAQPDTHVMSEDVMINVSGGRAAAGALPDDQNFAHDAARILRRLCETGSVLAVAEDMEKAVVVRDDASAANTRTAVVDVSVARAMALNDWIMCKAPGRISRYHITAVGRAALNRMVAEQESRLRSEREHGFAEAPGQFAHGSLYAVKANGDMGDTGAGRVRYASGDSPLIALARRKDRDGKPFLNDALVRAGERLREDFELAQMEPGAGQNWDRYLTAGVTGSGPAPGEPLRGPAAARDRVRRALAELGPGLSDVALRCCCALEGLETAEKRLGWSARSGKIVLRIALQRLKRHYDEASERDRMIG